MGAKRPKIQQYDPRQIIDHAAQVNRTNINTPFGSSEWSVGPDGRYSQSVEYSDRIKPLFDRAINLAGEEPEKFDVNDNPMGPQRLMPLFADAGNDLQKQKHQARNTQTSYSPGQRLSYDPNRYR